MESAIPRIVAWRLEDLYRKHYKRAYKVCLQYMKDPDEAHEMAQETFLKVNRGLPHFEGLCDPMTWIHRIAVNQCLSRLASRKREREGIVRYFDECGGAREREEGDGAARRMEAEILLKGANQVTRRILYLSFGQGLSHAQIALSLGVSRVAVTRRITRFRNQAMRMRLALEKRMPAAGSAALPRLAA